MYNVARLCKKKAPAGPAGLLFLTNFRSAIYKPCRLDVEMKLGAVRGRACATSDLSVRHDRLPRYHRVFEEFREILGAGGARRQLGYAVLRQGAFNEGRDLVLGVAHGFQTIGNA